MFRNQTALVVLYVTDSLKRISSLESLFRNRTSIGRTICFWFWTKLANYSKLFESRTALVVLGVSHLLKRTVSEECGFSSSFRKTVQATVFTMVLKKELRQHYLWAIPQRHLGHRLTNLSNYLFGKYNNGHALISPICHCIYHPQKISSVGGNPCGLWSRNLSGGSHHPHGNAKNTTAGCWKVG